MNYPFKCPQPEKGLLSGGATPYRVHDRGVPLLGIKVPQCVPLGLIVCIILPLSPIKLK